MNVCARRLSVTRNSSIFKKTYASELDFHFVSDLDLSLTVSL